MLARVELLELIDAVEHVTDELLQEDTRCHANPAAESAGHGGAPNHP